MTLQHQAYQPPSPESAGKASTITLTNVSLSYLQDTCQVEALRNISLDLGDKDFVCVLGPSGCGKSSLLNVIAGYRAPTAGSIQVDGKEHVQPDSQVGVVFQQPNLLPWLNIEKNIEFGLKMQRIPKEERKRIVAKYIKMVGLEQFAALLPYQLSGGMKQRAAIARTLATDPRVILLDEPFSALDALTRESMQKHLRAIWEETGKCLFFITHDVDEALLLAERILIMHPNPGRIVCDIPNPLVLRLRNQSFSALRSSKEFVQMREYLIGQIQAAN